MQSSAHPMCLLTLTSRVGFTACKMSFACAEYTLGKKKTEMKSVFNKPKVLGLHPLWNIISIDSQGSRRNFTNRFYYICLEFQGPFKALKFYLFIQSFHKQSLSPNSCQCKNLADQIPLVPDRIRKLFTGFHSQKLCPRLHLPIREATVWLCNSNDKPTVTLQEQQKEAICEWSASNTPVNNGKPYPQKLKKNYDFSIKNNF